MLLLSHIHGYTDTVRTMTDGGRNCLAVSGLTITPP